MASFFTKSLNRKLITLFLAVSLTPIAIVGYFSYSSGKKMLKKRGLDDMLAVVKSRENNILTLLQLRLEQIEILASNETLQILIDNWNKKENDKLISEAALKEETDNFIDIELS